ncbi:MAG: hypothetical protein QXQ81_02560, partial [Candidatus Thorarchaeota archaeon]
MNVVGMLRDITHSTNWTGMFLCNCSRIAAMSPHIHAIVEPYYWGNEPPRHSSEGRKVAAICLTVILLSGMVGILLVPMINVVPVITKVAVIDTGVSTATLGARVAEQ